MMPKYLFYKERTLKVGSREREKMANVVELRVEKGLFKGIKGSNIKKFEEKQAIVNDWLVKIHPDTSLEALCFKEVSDGIHSIRAYISSDGKFILTKRLPDKNGGYTTEKVKEAYLEKKGIKALSGTLILTTGHIDTRYATFRSNEYTEFLKKNDLTGYKHVEPNKEYPNNLVIYSDGTIDEDKENDTALVSNATWVITKNDKNRMLYTLKSYKKIILPKRVVSINEYVKILKKKFESLDGALQYLHRYFDFTYYEEFRENDIKGEADEEEYRASYYFNKDTSTMDIAVYHNLYWNTAESLSKSEEVKKAMYDADKKKFIKKILLAKGELSFIEEE